MYHEIEQEMEQLLQSLHDIDCARENSRRQIESHIFFDGAIKGDVLNNYVLQLISLIPKTLKVKIENCMKLKTPYGMQMRWRLPGGMFFHIHLKDNLRVSGIFGVSWETCDLVGIECAMTPVVQKDKILSLCFINK